MLIHREASQWEVVVPAKVNLFLEVLGKRSDGYHDLDTVMLAISLCDRLRFQATEDLGLKLQVTSASYGGFQKLSAEDNAWEIPTDHANLVVKALEAVRKRFGIVGGMNIELIKGIPSQAGLGGGSADAAGAIVGGMLAWLGAFHAEDAAELASGLGSDINFFIEGRSEGAGPENWLARCVGRGEQVSPIRSDWKIDLVIVHPPLGCSTKDVFHRLGETNRKENARFVVKELFQSMELRDRSVLAGKLYNRLEVPAAAGNPWIDRIRAILVDEPGVRGSCMSGSGSSVFAVVDTADRAEQLADRLRTQHPVRAYAVQSWQTLSIGEQLATLSRT